MSDCLFAGIFCHTGHSIADHFPDVRKMVPMLCHRDLRMTKRYAHLNVDSLRRAVSVLEGNSGYILATVGEEKESACSATP